MSVLQFSDFDLFLALGTGPDLRLSKGSRIYQHHLADRYPHGYRAHSFLLKFHALQACLENTQQRWLLLLDADALLVRPITEDMIRKALIKRGLGMVEQTTVRGSSMGSKEFLDHYRQHTLAWLAPEAQPPGILAFRYYNSGVVLGERNHFQEFTSWALATLDRNPGSHQVGKHMIGDQDYFQYWTNNLHPNTRNTLPWYWNHCEHWDQGFPRKSAYILHFSNFCLEPTYQQVLRMYLLRHNAWQAERLIDQVTKSLNEFKLGRGRDPRFGRF